MEDKNNVEHDAFEVKRLFRTLVDGIDLVMPGGGLVYLLIFMSVFTAVLYSYPPIYNLVNNLLEPYSSAIISAFMVGLFVTILYMTIVTKARIVAGPIHGQVTTATAISLKPLTEERIKRVACREAGHLLAIGLFGVLPNNIKAVVKGHQAPTLGNVQCYFDDDFFCLKESIENYMKMTIAGAIAEEMIFGNCMTGAQDCCKQWERRARDWLGSFAHTYEWFECPETEAEAMVNSSTLRQIKNIQKREVSAFLSKHSERLIQAMDMLIENREMEGEALLSLVRKTTSLQ